MLWWLAPSLSTSPSLLTTARVTCGYGTRRQPPFVVLSGCRHRSELSPSTHQMVDAGCGELGCERWGGEADLNWVQPYNGKGFLHVGGASESRVARQALLNPKVPARYIRLPSDSASSLALSH